MRHLTAEELEVFSNEMNDFLAKHDCELMVESKIVIMKRDEEPKSDSDFIIKEDGSDNTKTKETKAN